VPARALPRTPRRSYRRQQQRGRLLARGARGRGRGSPARPYACVAGVGRRRWLLLGDGRREEKKRKKKMAGGARASMRGRGADPTVVQGHRMSKTNFSLSSTGCNRSTVSCGLISLNQSVFWQTAQNRVSASKRPSLWMSARQFSLK